MSWNGRNKISFGQGRGRGRGAGGSLPVEARLQQTRDQHSTASQKALAKLQQTDAYQEYESSSEEDELDDDKIICNVLKTYKGGQDDTSTHLNTAVQRVYESCQSGAVTCLICISSVKRTEAIWNCCGCYETFHLNCIQRWIRDGIAKASVLSDDLFPAREQPWYCPKCRNEYSRAEQPFKYTCYCGAVDDPPFDPWIIPHSCGNTCNRLLKPDCGHHCLLLCHPGPCPQCPQTVKVGCYCKKQLPTTRRCGAREWSCAKQCSKILNCGKHACTDICHEGECGSCVCTCVQSCICQKSSKLVMCGTRSWTCDKICGRKYACGEHTCGKICHAPGMCGNCPKSGMRSCPCGKIIKEGLKCTEDVETCDDTCGKPLGCDAGHKCVRRCHYGPCGQCPVMIEKSCRCERRAKEMPCFKQFLCDIKCQKKRNCGNHQCRRKCCDGNCPSCDNVCGKTLQCKQHKCPSLCHQGMCYPCILTTKVTCKCGNSSITVVCGKQKSTKPPRCHKLCQEPSQCHHTVQAKHYCHLGKCPPCKQTCDILFSCGHNCPVACHDNVVVKHEIKAAGPWDLMQQTSTIEKLPCPDCKVPVPTQCLGKHDYFPLPCFEARPVNCGRKCDRKLKCTNHTCDKDCHEVINPADDESSGETCVQCERLCEKPRPEGCTHDCTSPCHPGDCEVCRKRIRKRCHCTMVIKHHLCCEWTAASDGDKEEMEECGGMCPKTLSCGHLCPNTCHAGECVNVKECVHRVNMRCKCKRKKKAFRCCDVQDGATVECDADCARKISLLKAETDEKARMENEEKERRQKIEVEKYERKMSKTKRRRKTESEDEKDNNKNQSLSYYVFLAIFAALTLSIYFYYQVFLL